MTAKALIFSLWLFTPGLLLAQTRQAPPPPAPSAQMYEDIEIMRRIINRKLAAWPSLVAMNQRCADCHAPSMAVLKNMGGGKFAEANETAGLGQGTPDIFIDNNNQATGEGLFIGDFNQDGWPDIFLLNNPHQARSPHVLMSIPWNTEGLYLKGHGVVYTVTLPPPPRIARPQGKKGPAKPLSDWDRIRRQLRQDNDEPKDPTANAAVQVDDWIERNLGDGGRRWVTETFIKIVAENGHHFSQLPENESLTVAITFRDAGQLKGVAKILQGNQKGTLESWSAQPQADGLQTWNVQQGNPGLQSWFNPVSPDFGRGAGDLSVGGENEKGKKDPSSIRDFELLGDLHLRQGKAPDAIKTYQQALNLSPEPKLAAELYRKIAQAHLTLKDDAKAKKALEMAEIVLKEARSDTQQPSAKSQAANRQVAAAPAVSKLILSARKSLLDQVGTGKLGYHDFEKQVTVETVGFATAETKGDKSIPSESK